jgi:hypothetical protein
MTEQNGPALGGCAEASINSTGFYIPCNKPATRIVRWPTGEGPYNFCAACAYTATAQRGAEDIGEYTGPWAGAEQAFTPPPPPMPVDQAAWVEGRPQQPNGFGEAAPVEVGADVVQIIANTFPTTTEAAHVAVEESEEAFKRRLVDEVQTWTEDKKALGAAKEAEQASRFALTATCFPNPVKGTQRFSLDGGYNVKLVHGWTYTLGDKDKTDGQGLKVSVYDQVAALEKQIAALGPEGQLLVERLIVWKPELKPTEYEQLARDSASEVEVQAKALIDEILTVKPASPQLTLEEPKAPK